MDERERLYRIDEMCRSVLGRDPAPGETLAEWRSAGQRIMLRIAMEARARGVIGEAQHTARNVEREVTDLIIRLRISSKLAW